MKDFRGTEVNIGDIVVVALVGGSYASYMQEAQVVGFCRRAGYDCMKLVLFNKNGTPNKYSEMYPLVRANHKIVKL